MGFQKRARIVNPIGLAALLGAGLCLRAGADLVSFGTSKDNTLYGDPGSQGNLSDGAGPHFYVGRASFGSNPRRGIIAFDVMSFVPAGATINSATLSLNCSRSVISTFSPTTLTFNRVTQDWGEGASNSGDPGGGGAPPAPGDATWLHTFYPNAFWTNPGGDFASTASGAFGGVAAAGAYTLSAAGMTADVAAWLSNPSSNFGWIVRADESTIQGAIRFDTKENAIASVRPALAVSFTPGGTSSGTWKIDADGSWTLPNWNGNAPNGSGAIATMGSVITAPRQVIVDKPVTAGTVNFLGAFRYTLAGPATLEIDSPTAGAINVLSGSHTVTAPLLLSRSTSVTVGQGTSTLSVLGNVTAAANVTLTKAGNGALEMTRARVDGLSLTGGKLSVLPNGTDNATSSVQTLSIASSGGNYSAKLDLNNNAMVVNYTGASPLSSIQSALVSGYQNGNWTGNGIASSSAAAQASAPHKTSLGYAENSALGLSSFHGQGVDGTSILIGYVYYGDANLDGTVDSVDFNNLAANFSQSGKAWNQADFNYDNTVDSVDFNLLASNFSLTLAAEAASPVGSALIPEPSAAVLAVASSVALLRRRRRFVSF